MKRILAAVPLLTLCAFVAVTHTRGTRAGQAFGECKSVLECEVELMEPSDIRIGPGYNYPAVGHAQAGERFGVIGMLSQWYIVQRDDGSVGLLESGAARITKLKEVFAAQGDGESDVPEDSPADFFRVVNSLRSQNGLQPFEWDLRLNKIASVKAEDMSKNNYFGHYSEIYGTPFNMLKEMDYKFKNASECIASKTEGKSLEIFTEAANRVNLMSGHFNKMGVGICDDGEKEITVLLFVKET